MKPVIIGTVLALVVVGGFIVFVIAMNGERLGSVCVEPGEYGCVRYELGVCQSWHCIPCGLVVEREHKQMCQGELQTEER